MQIISFLTGNLRLWEDKTVDNRLQKTCIPDAVLLHLNSASVIFFHVDFLTSNSKLLTKQVCMPPICSMNTGRTKMARFTQVAAANNFKLIITQ